MLLPQLIWVEITNPHYTCEVKVEQSEAPSVVTIVAMVALSEELDILKKAFVYKADHSTEKFVRLEFEIGTPGFRLLGVLAQNMGAMSALESMDEVIRDLDPHLVVCIGISGALSDDLKLGDVAVSNSILDVLHNTKMSGSGRSTSIHFSPRHYEVNASLSSSATFARNHPTLSAQLSSWRTEGQVAAANAGFTSITREDGPQVFVGPVVCGPVVASDRVRADLLKLDRKILALDTESGGIFNRLTINGVPGISIRGICDNADSSKNKLEAKTKNGVRALAMMNSVGFLKIQLQNPMFMSVAKRLFDTKHAELPGLLPASRFFDPTSLLVDEIADHLEGCDLRGKPSFKLPLPRVRAVSYFEDLSGKELADPVDLIDAIDASQHMLVRLPRSFPSQTIGWSLANSLIREELGGKIVLPIVISGNEIKRPRHGLESFLPENFKDIDPDVYVFVLLIEEPLFDNRQRMKFLIEEIKSSPHRIIVLTKHEDSVTSLDSLIVDTAFDEFELAPISFMETAAFLERAFDMPANEAESVAIRLDETFRKFRLDVHPTYFAGLQEDTIAALINANKRAELIQLAVVGLLSLIVAADKVKPRLGRTTREKFLRKLALAKNCTPGGCSEEKLHDLAKEFLSDNKFSTTVTQFLSPFFDSGMLYITSKRLEFSHPYLENFLLAEALREDRALAAEYFDPKKPTFDYYTFDLYAERGPHEVVIEDVVAFAEASLSKAMRGENETHVFSESRPELRMISNAQSFGTYSSEMNKAAKKLQSSSDTASIRQEKQRLLDTRQHARAEVGARQKVVAASLSPEIKREHDLLDDLARSFNVACIALGSGSESLLGDQKVELSNLILRLGDRFSDLWTRNRLRIDFGKSQEDLLSDDNIWSFMEEADIGQEHFSKIKSELQMFLHSFVSGMLSEPTNRVLWTISTSTGIPVLLPVIKEAIAENEFAALLHASWMLDVDPSRGKAMLKEASARFAGEPLLRIIFANHFLLRVYWHHYQSASAQKFIDSAKRVLSPAGMRPNQKRIDQAKHGPN